MLRKGDRVEVLVDGTWIDGVVLDVDNHSVCIQYKVRNRLPVFGWFDLSARNNTWRVTA